MVLTKQQKYKNSLVQKEQQQLLKIKKELDSIVVNINEAINVLKVEELQLKSSAVLYATPNRNKFQLQKRETEQAMHRHLEYSISQPLITENLTTTTLNLDVRKHQVDEDEDEI